LTGGAHLRPARPSLAEVAGLAAVVGGITAFAAWWWAHWRHGMPLFIDEAGYLSFAVSHARALEDGGGGDFLRSLDRQGPYGPLTPAVTAVGLSVVDRPAAVGAATMVGALAVFVVATWFLARRFCAPPWALLAAGVAGTLPGVLTLSAGWPRPGWGTAWLRWPGRWWPAWCRRPWRWPWWRPRGPDHSACAAWRGRRSARRWGP
jgi:hypothetical protein